MNSKKIASILTVAAMGATATIVAAQSVTAGSNIGERSKTIATKTIKKNDSKNQENKGSFRFNAAVLGSNGLASSGRKVQLFDITDGGNVLISTEMTNGNGIASFKNLPLGRSLSVSVDGVSEGYTTRTDVAGSTEGSSFSTSAVGTGTVQADGKPITIHILDADEGTALKNQTVQLTDNSGKVIDSLKTDNNGEVIFKNNLLSGTFYNLVVNGTKQSFVTPGASRTVYLSQSQEAKNQENKGSFQFNATVLGSNGLASSGRKVQLFDITDGGNVLISTEMTNGNGIASFKNLPLGRSLSVSVDGVSEGYTTRTDVAGSTEGSSFSTSAVGTGTVQADGKPITIHILDADEGTALKNQTVQLTDNSGKVIDSLKTDNNGEVIFKNNLLSGTFYNLVVNGTKQSFVTPGASRTVYLSQSQEAKNQENKGSFQFNATVLGSNGLASSGRKVQLFDITDGGNVLISTEMTNGNGIASFKNLPLGRSLSVSVDGVSEGYTTRTDVAGSTEGSSFSTSAVGTGTVQADGKPITIHILDADEGTALKNQTVQLTDNSGKVIDSLKTDNNGEVIFKNNLLSGTFYNLVVNGTKQSFVTPGASRTVYLSQSQEAKN